MSATSVLGNVRSALEKETLQSVNKNLLAKCFGYLSSEQRFARLDDTPYRNLSADIFIRKIVQEKKSFIAFKV